MFEFWLKNETKSEDILLPVTPEGYEISTGMEIETVRATNLGDINVAGRRKPKSITLSSFFPARDYPFVRKGGILLGNAAEYVKSWNNGRMRKISSDWLSLTMAVHVSMISFTSKILLPVKGKRITEISHIRSTCGSTHL